MFVVGSQILKGALVVLDDLVRVMSRSHDGFGALRTTLNNGWEEIDRGNDKRQWWSRKENPGC